MAPIGNLLAVGIAVGFLQSSVSTAQTPAPARHIEVELEDTGKAPGDLTESTLEGSPDTDSTNIGATSAQSRIEPLGQSDWLKLHTVCNVF